MENVNMELFYAFFKENDCSAEAINVFIVMSKI